MVEQSNAVVDDPVKLERGRVLCALAAADPRRVECDHPEEARQMGDLHLPDQARRDLPGREQQDRRPIARAEHLVGDLEPLCPKAA
jgi:hypothetical protein